MFTLQQIETAHQKVKSGADFPAYIQEIKQLGVVTFHTWVQDSHTQYFGADDYNISSAAQYQDLTIADHTNSQLFQDYLVAHQQGKTDYYQFCKDCAQTGIQKWVVDLHDMTCTYYDQSGNKILEEKIPS